MDVCDKARKPVLANEAGLYLEAEDASSRIFQSEGKSLRIFIQIDAIDFIAAAAANSRIRRRFFFKSQIIHYRIESVFDDLYRQARFFSKKGQWQKAIFGKLMESMFWKHDSC